jgi:hypothetical protein
MMKLSEIVRSVLLRADLRPWDDDSTEIAMKLAYDAGRSQALKDAADHCRTYREAYAEDMFTPIASGEKNDGTDRFTTRVSGHMGRFVLDNVIRDIPALGEEE